MKQLILTKFPWTWLPVTALVIFFVFFVGMILFINLKSKRAGFNSASKLPLEDGHPHSLKTAGDER